MDEASAYMLRPASVLVIVPMCGASGRIPWGSAHTRGHLKAYLDVAAIRARENAQGSNLNQFCGACRGKGSEGGARGGGSGLHLDKVMGSQVG